ncbi:MAG TPA: FAD-binding oxidoreductase [Candidatus Acidoferrum sp.]|nr:FAD-binding oxidoreductase [Candidatus Acidoferrum sp.]
MPPTPTWGTPPWEISFRSKLTRLPAHVDIAIIGAGFTGLAAAASLKRLAPNKSVLLLEAKRVGNGASGRTGGMVLAETAAGNLPGLGDVLRSYRKILRDLGINADLALPGVWEIARSSHSMEGKKLRPLQNSPIDWSDSGRVRVVKKVPGGTVDPGKVVDGLARAAVRAGALIAENAQVTRVDPTDPIRIHVSRRGKRSRIITASRVLLATNAGGLSLAQGLFNTSPEPKLTFALATAPLTRKQLAALGMSSRRPFYTVDLPYLWGRLFRVRAGRKSEAAMIFGSGLVPAFEESLSKRHKKKLWRGLENENVLTGSSRERLNALEHRVRALHPVLKNVRITHRWGGPILLTKNFVPIFRTHPKNKNLLFLGAYSGHGVALSGHLGHWAAHCLAANRNLPNWR